ncbi:DUF3152 domain-containing protein [Streptomyces sp. NPDC004838]
MGRHSRKSPAPKGPDSGSRAVTHGGGTGAREADPYDTGGHRVDPYDTGSHRVDPYDTGSHRVDPHDTGSHGLGAYGTGAHPVVPRSAEHTATGYGTLHARGGHPEQHEAGGGWGTGPLPAGYETRRRTPVQATPGPMATGSRIPGPRQDFIQAFDGPGAEPTGSADRSDPYASVTERPGGPGPDDRIAGAEPGVRSEAAAPRAASPADSPEDARTGSASPAEQRSKGGRGRTFTGVAAAAVTTVLAVIVAGQVATDGKGKPEASAAGSGRSDDDGSASRSDDRQSPPPAQKKAATATPTYEQLMATRFAMNRELTADGTFEAVPGSDKAPGKGNKVRYRVDVEKGLGMDGALFAAAVHRTLNDERSWARGGAMTFERISSGEPKFVITLASPGTTDVWCAKSGLNTSIDKVSCDSASTDRVMINAYRWAQGSGTYGPGAMFAYRQMLINHEVGHRLGHGHVSCRTEGAPAPVMQQQTKSLNINGIKCRPNPWPYPKN